MILPEAIVGTGNEDGLAREVCRWGGWLQEQQRVDVTEGAHGANGMTDESIC